MSSLPDWLDPLYEADEMRAVDAWAIGEMATPSLDLMERAGAGLARAVAAAAGDGPVCVVVGKGNNGGDGLVAARHLREDGHEVRVLAVAPLDDLRGDAAANLERSRASRRSRSSPSGSRAPAWWWTRCSAPASRARRATRWRGR